jgi:hypothetical protein
MDLQRIFSQNKANDDGNTLCIAEGNLVAHLTQLCGKQAQEDTRIACEDMFLVKTLTSGRLRQASLAGRRRSRRRFARRANPNAPKREFHTTFVGGHMSKLKNLLHLMFTLEFWQTLTHSTHIGYIT